MKNLLILLLLIGCTQVAIKPEKKDIIVEVENSSFYKSESSLSWIAKAIEIADCVTVNKDFHNDILDNGEFTHYTGSSQAIIDSLMSSTTARVGSYYKWKSKAVAYRNQGSDKIWFNRYHAKRSINQKVNTMIHERLHVLGYGHKGNKSYKYNNLSSVPYKVGKIGERYSEGCKPKENE